jgi:glycosyltransferase involved in cell wall biosynthesis
MKAIYISNATVPSYTANSIQVMKMCQAMVQRGHQVELLAPRRQIASDLKDMDIWYHYGINNTFPIRWLPWPGRAGGHLYGWLSVLHALRANANILYTRHLPAAAMGALAKIPTVCELHGMPGGYTGSFYLRLFVRQKHSRSYVVVISNALKQDLIDVYHGLMDKQRIVVAPDGVDLERFAHLPDPKIARRRLGLDEEGFIAGYSGHFYPGKGIDIILNLASTFPQIRFLIMGGEPGAVANLRKRVDDSGLRNVLVQGFIPNKELPWYLAACEALLLPIQRIASGSSGGNIARWTSPMKLFEYMATGRLIIASDLPVLREVLNENNASLCDPDEPESWRKSLERAMVEEEWRRALAQQARKDAQQYAWTARIDKCLRPYIDRLEGRDDRCR